MVQLAERTDAEKRLRTFQRRRSRSAHGVRAGDSSMLSTASCDRVVKEDTRIRHPRREVRDSGGKLGRYRVPQAMDGEAIPDSGTSLYDSSMNNQGNATVDASVSLPQTTQTAGESGDGRMHAYESQAPELGAGEGRRAGLDSTWGEGAVEERSSTLAHFPGLRPPAFPPAVMYVARVDTFAMALSVLKCIV